MISGHFFTAAFFIFIAYYLLATAYYLILGGVGFFEDRKRARQHREEDYTAFSVSTFTIPVSVIIPAHNEEAWIRDSVQSILNLNYPEFELIVVDDGSTDKTLTILKETLELRFVFNPYVDHFQSGKVLGLFKSKLYPHVTVIHKESGQKKAGAVNAALNIAKYKFVCVMDGDTVLEPDIVLKVMAHIQKDPERLIGVGSYFGLANEFGIKDGRVIKKNFLRPPTVAYQDLEYVRSFIGARIAWSRWNTMPIVAGGFGLWRRDVFVELGGYDPQYSSEDVEFTFRAHDYVAKNSKLGYQILMLPYCAGWTEGPGDVSSLMKQRNRWHRVTAEAVWDYKYMMCNPRYGRFAFVTFPYFVLYEVLGVFFELGSILMTLVGYAFGFIDQRLFFGIFLFMVLCQALASLIPLFAFQRDQKIFNTKEISYFVCLGWIEFFWYRWIISFAKLLGTYDYLCGVRTYDRVRRFKVNHSG